MSARFARYAHGRKRPGSMNKLEGAYAHTLEARKTNGEVLWFAYEAIKLRLADKTFYTPDFFLMTSSGELECHEVKGFWEDDARVKIKCAAEKFPIVFKAIQRKRGEWIVEEF